MGKTTQSTQTSSSPPANVLANYQALVDRATNVANTPYQPYNGQVVPDLTQNQNQAFNQLSNLYGYSDPLYIAAAQFTGQGATPINLSAGYTGQFNSPYAQAGAANANSAGQGLAAYGMNAGQGLAGYGVNAGQGIGAYGTNAGQNIAGFAQNIGGQGPQLQQYNQHNLQPYLNPYTQNVIDTTSANIDRSNSVQQNNLTGSAILGGNAFGGNRAGVAAAELARNQDLAKNQTIAGLESAGFQNAQSQFNTNNQQALAGQQTALSGLTSGSQLGLGALGTGAQLGLSGLGQGAQLGLSGQQAGGQLGLAGSTLGNQGYQNAQQLALAQQQQQNANQFQASGQLQNIGQTMFNNQGTAAQAQLAAGNQQQQQQAAQLAWPYQQYQQATAFPYQQTQFLGNTILGTGSASGGTGTTTSPGPNWLTQAAGLGIAGAGLFLKDGGGIRGYASGGNIAASNIQPINFSAGPLGLAGLNGNMGQTTLRGKGPPSAPNVGAASNNTSGLQQQLGGLAGAFSGGSSTMGSPGVSSPLSVIGGAGDYAVPTFMSRGGFASSGGLVPYSPFGGAFADGGDVIDATDLLPLDEKYLGLGQPWSNTNAAIANDVGGGPKMPPPMPPQPQGLAAVASPPIAPQQQSAGLATPMPQPRPSLPPEIAAGQSGEMASADQSQPDMMSYAPSQGLRAAPPPQAAPNGVQVAQAQGFTAPESPKPSLGQALMAAGLGMMASRSPTLLGGVGEGGLAGLNNYEQQQKQINDLDAHPVIDNSGPTQRIYYPSTKQWIDTGMPTQTAAQSAQTEETKRARAQEDTRLKLEERRIKLSEDKTPAGYRSTDNGMEPIPGGPADPDQLAKLAKAKQGPGLSDTAKDIKARQMINGDYSGLTNIGRGAQAGRSLEEIGNRAAEILVDEGGMTPAEAAAQISRKTQEYKATGTYKNAEARTAAGREANLNLILNATEAAIPAAIDASKQVARTGWVPINKIIQGGEVIASDPALKRFGMANLQLAEHWARAMNPLGVMRESDRDMALKYLNTADSQSTYEAAVNQLHTQILRERDAVRRGSSMPSPNAATPAPGSGSIPGASAAPSTNAPSKPTLQEFLAKAKAANPGATDQQLTDYYNKKYGS